MSDPITINKVRVTTGGLEPVETTAWLRTVGRGPGWSSEITSTKGSPPDWDQPHFNLDRNDVTGSYEPAEGAQITIACNDDQYPPDSSGEPYQEVMIAMKTGPGGASLRSFWIDYSAEGTAYTVEVPWQMVLCGTKAPSDICEKGTGDPLFPDSP